SFPFEYAEIRAPYTPEVYQDAITAADKVGFDVVIVDSMSHEYESEGGIQEIADQYETGILKPGKTMRDTEGRDGWQAWEIKPVKSPGNWKEPKTRHKRMVNRAIQSRAHVIFCLRAEEKMLLRQVPQLDNNGEPKMWNGKPQMKTEVVAAADRPLLDRWVPICEKRFMYEMTVSFLLLPGQPGVGHPIKNLQDQFLPMFPEGGQLGVINGAALAAWSHGRKTGSTQAATELPTQTAAEPTEAKGRQTPDEWADEFIGRVNSATERPHIEALEKKYGDALARLRKSHPELGRKIDKTITDRRIDIDAGDLEGGPADSQRGEGATLFGEN
ncbi:MAG TPA: hypothetical protein VJK06_01675, partial [Methyloceanibacter sp.]|nr:hypothetical protein [Methyloceanibacter sp.]